MSSARPAVVELTPALERPYADFVAGHPDAMIYPTLEFRDFLRRCVPGDARYLVALRGADVVGVFPAFSAHDPRWGTVVNSLPWYGSHGGCLVDPADTGDVRAALLGYVRGTVLGPDTGFATVIVTPHEESQIAEYCAVLKPEAIDRRTGQITELPAAAQDVEAALERLCWPKTRNLIRKSLKQGFELELADDDEAWRFLHDTHLANMAAIGGRAKPWTHFAAMRETIPAAWRRLYVARREGTPVAALLLLLFNRTVEYLTPVIVHEFRSLQPLSFIIWHAMLDASRLGARWWNWGGTWISQRSLHHFKAGWGAADHPYSYLVTLTGQAKAALARDRAQISGAFPYYFIYPFALLDD